MALGRVLSDRGAVSVLAYKQASAVAVADPVVLEPDRCLSSRISKLGNSHVGRRCCCVQTVSRTQCRVNAYHLAEVPGVFRNVRADKSVDRRIECRRIRRQSLAAKLAIRNHYVCLSVFESSCFLKVLCKRSSMSFNILALIICCSSCITVRIVSGPLETDELPIVTVRRYHPAVLSDLGHSGLIAEVLSADIATPVSAVSGLGAGCRSRRVSGKRMRLDQLSFAAVAEAYGVISVIAEEYVVVSAVIGRKSAGEYHGSGTGRSGYACDSNAVRCAGKFINNINERSACGKIYIAIGVVFYLRISGDLDNTVGVVQIYSACGRSLVISDRTAC